MGINWKKSLEIQEDQTQLYGWCLNKIALMSMRKATMDNLKEKFRRGFLENQELYLNSFQPELLKLQIRRTEKDNKNE